MEVLGIFTVQLGREVIWNFPRQFVTKKTIYPDGGDAYSYGVRDLNELLRDYLDTRKDVLLKKEFVRDYYGMTHILKAADRRLGFERLQKHFENCELDFVKKVLSVRSTLHHC